MCFPMNFAKFLRTLVYRTRPDEKTKHCILQSWIINEFGFKSENLVLYPVEKEIINLRIIDKVLQFLSLTKKSRCNTNHPGNKLP